MRIETQKASIGTYSIDALENLWAVGIHPVTVNDIYLANFFRPERIQIWYGGSGGGKSDAKAAELLLKCIFNPYCRVMFCRKTKESIRMSQFRLFKDLIKRYGFSGIFRINETAMTLTCTENGNMLFGSGLDDMGKITSIADVTDIWLEEPIDRKGTVSSSDFTELNRRLRSVKASNHIHLTFNPISKESWIHDYFFKSDIYKPFVLCTTYLDNHFTPESQKDEFEILKIKKPDEYAVYALGEWGTLKQGLVFPEYSIVKDWPINVKRWGYGLDWGFYPDPCTLIKCGIGDGKLYLDEVVFENNLTSATRSERMKQRGVSQKTKIIADSNPEAIAEMKTKGWFNIESAKKGPGSIKAGISLMQSFDICLTAKSINLKAEFDNYEWAKERMSETPTGDPVDAWNHGIDAARYWTMANATQKQGVRFA
jgi:phage terminase large subunit